MMKEASARSEVRILKSRVASLELCLNSALNHQVANRGTKHQFYRCYTYQNGELPKWVATAIRLLDSTPTRSSKTPPSWMRKLTRNLDEAV